ncbi:conserved hypothetical protein (plasmid) [Borreliella finlandensis]|uniref:Uncharacterized protein n=1 Tax=Borreliella finlandensis TaxID=498741 RepID=A0A806C783_9SPIR|nr:conserved hypothetical protein [Borreliella finlandensis]
MWNLDLKSIVCFCYFKGLYCLRKKDRINNHYNKAPFDIFIRLEKQVYGFYGKKYSEKGSLTKWTLKNLK